MATPRAKYGSRREMHFVTSSEFLFSLCACRRRVEVPSPLDPLRHACAIPRQTDPRMDISCFARHSPSLAQVTKLSPNLNYEGVLTTKLFLIGQYAWRTHATKTRLG